MIRAQQVVIATNGYTGPALGSLAARSCPSPPTWIATEELPPDLASSILPTNRAVSESRRVVNHYRLSPDGLHRCSAAAAPAARRPARTTARLLYRAMLKRFPLAGTRLTCSWGGNVAMTLDSMPHIGGSDGLRTRWAATAAAWPWLDYLGHSVGRKIARQSRIRSTHSTWGKYLAIRSDFGNTWFLFAIGSWVPGARRSTITGGPAKPRPWGRHIIHCLTRAVRAPARRPTLCWHRPMRIWRGAGREQGIGRGQNH